MKITSRSIFILLQIITMAGGLATFCACHTTPADRQENRQDTRTEHRTDDRMDRRRGDKD